VALVIRGAEVLDECSHVAPSHRNVLTSKS
jgi:hypothetical protein